MERYPPAPPVRVAVRPAAHFAAARSETRVKAVLGPTNTGKTHLAIERLCAHSSGAIGFPLRLLAREVYDKVCAIKGEKNVALITGEERIEPRDARWLLCTAEAMPVLSGRPGRPAEGPVLSGRPGRPAEGPMNGDLAFVAIDEAQLAADRERGHIFTDRLLHARGREETMILGAQTLEPLVRKLVPEAEIVSRPRFSTLSHIGAKKLSRIPPRSAIVAFSAEQVYAIAEMLRRFRGGSAVVMGALSPQTRNAQVALYQSGEVDYLVATDAVGMGLNLDIEHVAFAGLSKFDGIRQRRLTTAEMAQIAGRAGRHQRDGTFGTLSGTGHHDAAFTDEEVYAIEEHRFAPLTRLFWRDPEPHYDSLATLMTDLEAPPERAELVPAPEAIDLAVLKRLSEDPAIAATVTTSSLVARFWETCRLPDFRHHGAETHSRFVARLWEDRRHGTLGADYVAQAIAQLDNTGGDIDTLQGRIAAIRSWAYIAQRPDWVLAREEMAARARGVEARLSDALHARLTERFVNRRTSVLMRKLGPDAGLLPVTLDGDVVMVDGEPIGTLAGFRFAVDSAVRHADRKLLLAAAERHVPALLEGRARSLAERITVDGSELSLKGDAILSGDIRLARIEPGRRIREPRLVPDSALAALPDVARSQLMNALSGWLAAATRPLAPLARLEDASRADEAGPDLRALLIRLIEGGGAIARSGSGIERIDRPARHRLGRLGVRIGALDLFVPQMLRPEPLRLWRMLAPGGSPMPAPEAAMPPVLPARRSAPPAGYRRAGKQDVRIDMAEKLLRVAHEARVAAGRRPFRIDPGLATSMGLTPASHAQLLRFGGFRQRPPRPLAHGASGPPAPLTWSWRPPRRDTAPPASGTRPATGAFAALAELVR